MHPGVLLFTTLAALAEGVSFDEALQRVGSAPALVAARQAATVSRAVAARIPVLTANPQILVQGGYRFLSAPERGVEGQLHLQQSFNLDGYGARRRDSAQKEAQVLADEARVLALGQQLATARTWTTLWGATAAYQEARQEVTLAAELLRRTERAAAVQLLTQVDVAEARAYQAEAELQALAYEGEVFELGTELALQVGAAAERPLVVRGELPAPAAPPVDVAQAIARAGELPAVALRRTMERAEAARERELRSSRGTQLLAGVSVVREAPAALVGLLTLGLTLPIFDHGEREQAALLANRARLAGEGAALQRQAAGELALVFHEVEHSGDVLYQLRERLVPVSAETVRLREAAAKAGTSTVLELLLARRVAAAARGRLARAQATHALARVRLALFLHELTHSDAQGAP